MNAMTFLQHTTPLAVVRLDADAEVPAWVAGEFVSITRTTSELSLVCNANAAPPHEWDVDPWTRFEVVGPLDLSITGIMAHVAGCLADAQIPLFAIATYDTDHILVRQRDADGAAAALRSAGHVVR